MKLICSINARYGGGFSPMSGTVREARSSGAPDVNHGSGVGSGSKQVFTEVDWSGR